MYESLYEDVKDFFSEETREEYIKYGIPYKKTSEPDTLCWHLFSERHFLKYDSS